MRRHGGTLMRITQWKKPIWKGYTLYESNHMTFQKGQNFGDSKKISGCQGCMQGDE